MLTYMRKHSRSWFIKLIFGAIIVTFVAWGGSTYWAKEQNKIAKIDKHIISVQQYSKAYENTLKAYEQQYGAMFTPEIIKMLKLNEKVLDQMIDNYILEQEAKRLGVSVSKADLQDAIRTVPAFVSGGQFDMDRYKNLLEQYNLTPQQFEDQQRQEMIRERLYAILTDNVFVTPDEVNAAYHARKDTLDLAFITVSPEQFSTVSVGENDITAWYDSHKEAYKIAPQTKIAYIIFDAPRYVNVVQVSPEEINRYYDDHRAEYAIPEKVRARHILIATAPEADAKAKAAREQDARKVLEQAKAGGDFGALAKKYSQDQATSKNGGELGPAAKNELPEGLGDVLFNMKPGDIRGPVRTARGFEIVKLEEKLEGRERPLEEVSTTITQTLRERKAKDMAYEEANKAFSAVYEQAQMDLAGFAKQRNLPLVEFGPFAENEKIGLPMGEKIVKDAISRPEGDLGDLIDIGNGYLLYKVTAKTPSRIPELKEVRDKVIADVTKSKRLEAAQKYAKDLAAQPKAQLEAMNPESTGPFTRSTWAIPKIGMEAQIKKDLDNLQQAKVYTVREKVYVVWLKQYQQAALADLKEGEARTLRDELTRQKKELIFETFLKQAKARHNIVIDREKLL